MADIIDNAQEQEELIILAALSNRPKPSMVFTGRCYWCGEAIRGVIFARVIVALKIMSDGLKPTSSGVLHEDKTKRPTHL